MSDYFWIAIAALVGWIVGMVINNLSDDLPYRQNPQAPHYPNGSPRPLIAWSGILAFLTGNRQGDSIRLTTEEEKELSLAEIAHLELDTKLPWRHPIVELIMIGIFAGVVAYFPDHPRLIVWLIYISVLMLITVIDWEHRLILFVVSIPSIIGVLIINAIAPSETPTYNTRTYSEFIFGGLVGGGVFFLMYLGGGVFADIVATVRRRSLSEVAFGFGDVILATLCGLMIGWRSMIFAIFITVFAGAIGALLYMTWRLFSGRRYDMYTALPYGPYIVLGAVLMMLFVEPIRDTLRELYF